MTEQHIAHDIVTVYSTYLMPLPKNLKVTDDHKGLNLYELVRWAFSMSSSKTKKSWEEKKTKRFYWYVTSNKLLPHIET